MRNNQWLKNRFDYIWSTYFADIEKINPIEINFGKKARTRLGSIKSFHNHPNMKNRLDLPSIITITGFFQDEAIPVEVVDATIAHEICHYAQGFSSAHDCKYDHPHRGNIVDHEMAKRGLGDELIYSHRWLKKEWPSYLKTNSTPRVTKRRKSKRTLLSWLIS
ncbi:MAG: hypothetical protein WCO23_05130 [bacterium]